jgi:hypothetical protein
MCRPFLAIFRQLLTFWNRRTALYLKSVYFHAITLLLLTLKHIFLRTKLTLLSSLFTFCSVHVSVMCNIRLLSMERCIIIIWICYLYMSVCYFVMYLHAPCICIFSLLGRMSLVWALSVIVSAYISFLLLLYCYLSYSFLFTFWLITMFPVYCFFFIL